MKYRRSKWINNYIYRRENASWRSGSPMGRNSILDTRFPAVRKVKTGINGWSKYNFPLKKMIVFETILLYFLYDYRAQAHSLELVRVVEKCCKVACIEVKLKLGFEKHRAKIMHNGWICIQKYIYVTCIVVTVLNFHVVMT